MSAEYQTGIKTQSASTGFYTRLVLATAATDRYRHGMSILKDLRTKAGLTAAALAEKIGTQQPQITRWEHEPGHPEHRKVPLGYALRLAGEFNVPITVILPELADANSIDLLLKDANPEVREKALQAVLTVIVQFAT